MGDSVDEVRLRRVKFRAWHRGFREADLILGPFADQFLDGFTSDQMDAFETLMSDRDYVCGDRFTMADVSVGYAVMLALDIGLEEQVPDARPRTKAAWRWAHGALCKPPPLDWPWPVGYRLP